MDEAELIAALLARSAASGRDWLEVGIGDDTAVIIPPAADGWRLLIGVDAAIDTVHFRLDECAPSRAAGKAVRRAISDIAAMGGGERGFILASVTFDRARAASERLEVLMGIADATQACGFTLVGGDISATARGPLAIHATAGAFSKAPITRSGAAAGEAILVTGRFGGSLRGRHLDFVPRMAAAAVLRDGVRPTAMIDVSDGLALDLSRLLAASGVGGIVEAARIPLHPDANGELARALDDGEDHELIFTLPRARVAALPPLLADVEWTLIGETTSARGLFIKDERGALSRLATDRGFDHLRAVDRHG